MSKKAIANKFKASWTYDEAPESTDHIQVKKQYELFIEVSREEVERVLKRARLKANHLYQDSSHVFSAIFARMPPLPLEERIQRLTKACDTIIVLESGTLPDTGDPYIDFGFTGPPE